MELHPIARVQVEALDPDKRPPIYDLTIQRDMAPNETRICQTCVHDSNRVVACEGGIARSCTPDEYNVTLRVMADGCQIRSDVTHGHSGNQASIALVHSCGWAIRSECAGCAHFVALTHGNRQLGSYADGVRRHTTIAGYCGLPPEGVKLKSGAVVHCLPERRMFTVLDEATCDTCSNCAQATPFYGAEFLGVTELGGTIVRTGADPWEQNQAKKAYAADPENADAPSRANWRLTKAQASSEMGFTGSYRAEVLELAATTETRTDIDGKTITRWNCRYAKVKFAEQVVELKFRGNEATKYRTRQRQRFAAGRFIPARMVDGTVPPGQIRIEPSVNADEVVIHLQLWPWRKLFGIPLARIKLYLDPTVPWHREFGSTFAPVPAFADPDPNQIGRANRVNPRCPRCKPDFACDAHARQLVWEKLWDPVLRQLTESLTFADPSARDRVEQAPPLEAHTVWNGKDWTNGVGGPQNLSVLRHQLYRLGHEARRLELHGGQHGDGAAAGLHRAWVAALDQRIARTSRLDSELKAAEFAGKVPRPSHLRYGMAGLSDWSKRLMRETLIGWEDQLRTGTLEGAGRHLSQVVGRLPVANYDMRALGYPVARPGVVHVRDDKKKFNKEIFWEDGPWMVYHRPSQTMVWPSGTLESRKYYCFAFLHGEEGLDLPKVMGIRDMGESFWGPTTQLADKDPRAKHPGSYHTGEFHRYDVEDYLRANDMGARIQESIDAALWAGGIWNPYAGAFTPRPELYGPPVPPELWRTTRYDLHGTVESEDNWAGGYDRKADQVEFAGKPLDAEGPAIVGWLNEEHIVDGARASNRWRYYGSGACLTGAARPEHRDTDVDSVWGEDPHWNRDLDEDDPYEEDLAEAEAWDTMDGDLDADDTGLDITDAMHEEEETPWRRYEIICLDCAEHAATPEEAVVGFTIDEVVKPTWNAQCPRCKKHNTVVVEMIGDDGTKGGERGYCPYCRTMYRGITPANDVCLSTHCRVMAKNAAEKAGLERPEEILPRLVLVDEGIRFEAYEQHRKIRIFRSSDDKIQRRQLERHGADCPSWVRAERGARRYRDDVVPTTVTSVEIKRKKNRQRQAERQAKRWADT
jgi:hypothetical protein